MGNNDKLRVLCVYDEPNVLEELALHLRRRYEVVTAASGQAGLELLEKNAATAVVISNMRMSGMDGATFLSRVRAILPDTVRILLTGQSDLSSDIKVNDRQLFRFLRSQCAPQVLLTSVEAAVLQYLLLSSERVLLRETNPASASSSEQLVRRCAQVLKVVSDLDFLEAQGNPLSRAFDTMRGRVGEYDQVLDAYAELRGRSEDIREMRFSKLCVGMVLVEDVVLRSGMPLTARGFEAPRHHGRGPQCRRMRRTRGLPGCRRPPARDAGGSHAFVRPRSLIPSFGSIYHPKCRPPL